MKEFKNQTCLGFMNQPLQIQTVSKIRKNFVTVSSNIYFFLQDLNKG